MGDLELYEAAGRIDSEFGGLGCCRRERDGGHGEYGSESARVHASNLHSKNDWAVPPGRR